MRALTAHFSSALLIILLSAGAQGASRNQSPKRWFFRTGLASTLAAAAIPFLPEKPHVRTPEERAAYYQANRLFIHSTTGQIFEGALNIDGALLEFFSKPRTHDALKEFFSNRDGTLSQIKRTGITDPSLEQVIDAIAEIRKSSSEEAQQREVPRALVEQGRYLELLEADPVGHHPKILVAMIAQTHKELANHYSDHKDVRSVGHELSPERLGYLSTLLAPHELELRNHPKYPSLYTVFPLKDAPRELSNTSSAWMSIAFSGSHIGKSWNGIFNKRLK